MNRIIHPTVITEPHVSYISTSPLLPCTLRFIHKIPITERVFDGKELKSVLSSHMQCGWYGRHLQGEKKVFINLFIVNCLALG
jgi:hypothetical protein